MYFVRHKYIFQFFLNINNYDFLKVKLIYKVKKLIKLNVYKCTNSYQAHAYMSNQLENMPITHTCAICLEELTVPSPNICITECAHVFHLNCFLQNREYNITCPMCRSDIPIGEPQEVQELNVLPDGMLEENVNAQQNMVFNIYDVFEEVAIGCQLEGDIIDIVHSASNNNISNFDMNPHETIDMIHEQIYHLCINFVNSTSNYLRNIADLRYNINHLNYNNIYMQFYINRFDLHERIAWLVDNAANNNILDNRTFDRMEHDIHNLCFEFNDYVIVNGQNRDNSREV